MQYQKLCAVTLAIVSLTTPLKAYNIYLERVGKLSPYVEVTVSYEGGLSAIFNNVRFVKYKSTKELSREGNLSRFGSWNYKDVRLGLFQKVPRDYPLYADITVNHKKIRNRFYFQAGGSVVVTPVSDHEVRVTCNYPDNGVQFSSVYNY